MAAIEEKKVILVLKFQVYMKHNFRYKFHEYAPDGLNPCYFYLRQESLPVIKSRSTSKRGNFRAVQRQRFCPKSTATACGKLDILQSTGEDLKQTFEIPSFMFPIAAGLRTPQTPDLTTCEYFL